MSRLFKGLLALLAVILAGCAGGQQTTAPLVSLPLATGQPTFFFFYTDN